MSAITRARVRWACSGGKSRVGDPAADDADGALELDPVRVHAGGGGGLADQGADRVVGEQVAVDLLPDHVRGLRSQHPARPAQVGLELLVAGLNRPPLIPLNLKSSLVRCLIPGRY